MKLARKTLILAATLLGLASGAARAQPALQGLAGDALAQMQAAIKAAAAEGQVGFVDGVLAAETGDELAAAFRRHYGLPSNFRVSTTHGNTSVIVTKIDQELAAKRVATDLVGLAVPSWVFQRAAAGDIMKYRSPEYVHYQRVFDLGMGLPDYFAIDGTYFFVPAWNDDTLKFSGTSWRDILTAVPPGRINMGNAETSLANLMTFMAVRRTMGDDFYPKLGAMKPQIIQAGESANDRLLSGQDLMTLYGQATHTKYRNDLGAHIKMMIPKEGVVLLPQCLFIMTAAPHPQAARLLLDFVLSAEGQKIIIDREALISGREGAPSPLPDYSLRLEDIPVIKVDWAHTTAKDLDQARADWVKIFK